MAIASLVKSLGDFPLDPDQGQAWLWTGDGARLLWLSAGAADELGVANGSALPDISHGQSLESFAVELGNLQPDRQPIRVKQVPLSVGRRSELFTCLCRHVPLADGSGFGLLTVAIGAPPRLARTPAPEPAALSEPPPAEPPPSVPPPAVPPPAEPPLFVPQRAAPPAPAEPVASPPKGEATDHRRTAAPPPATAASAPTAP
ncbi:MAG: hypothetical protein ACRCTI_06800, partial [Beijerinckiaceae bacterium]